MSSRVLLFLTLMLTTLCCHSQTSSEKERIGGPCEGCEAALQFTSEPANAIAITEAKDGSVPIEISGVIYHQDGTTPASGIVLYVYHTDESGVYPTRKGDSGWARRHGYLRGWIKTNSDGSYKFRTIRPASYPNTTIEQHIHATIAEPDKNPYYIDDFTFADDPNLSRGSRTRVECRGGCGVLTLVEEKGTWIAARDIILGQHIPAYY